VGIGKPLAIVFLTIGLILMLQASRAFQVKSNFRFIITIIVSALLMIIVDFWPIQVVYARAVSTVLQLLGIPSIQSFTPYLGGIQILLFVQDAGSGLLVGGEIDNACAGLILLLPALILLFLANRKEPPYPDSVLVGVFAVCLVVLGNFCRIIFELWAPAVALAPFELVHYPLAFILGSCGLGVIIWWGHKLRQSVPW
jgi:exosortase/archaeosortase family protein